MSDPLFPEKISRKIRLYLIAAFSVVAVTGAFSILSTRGIFLNSRKITSLNQHIEVMDQSHILFHHLINELHRAMILKTLDRREQIHSLEQQLGEQLVLYRAMNRVKNPSSDQKRETALVEDMQESARQLLALSLTIQKVIARGEPVTRKEVDLIDNIAHRVPPLSEQLNALHLAQIQGAIQHNTSNMNMILWIYAGFLALGTAGIILGIRKFSTAIVHPLRLLTSATVEIGTGALDKRIPVTSRDEFGQLSHFFNQMLEGLEDRECKLRESQRNLARHVRELEALHRINMEISGLLDLDQVLNLVVEKARELMGADIAALLAPTEGRNGFIPQAFSSLEGLSLTAGPKEQRSFSETSRPVFPDPECAIPEECRAAYLSAPLKRGDSLIGILCIGCRSVRTFTSEEVNLLQGLATQAAIAMENASIVKKLETLATLEERERIAREMHDGLAQTLGFLYASIHSLQDRTAAGKQEETIAGLKTMGKVVGDAYDEVRQSIFGLRIMVSRSLGLIPTLTEYLHEFSAHAGIQVSLNVLDERGTRFTPAAEVQLIRIIQEALTNVRKHSRATRAAISFDYRKGNGEVIIEDNGVGFDASVRESASDLHFGLQSMKERAEVAGGRFQVQSCSLQGTSIVVTAPVTLSKETSS